MYEHPKNGSMDTLSIWFSRVAMWLPAFIVCIMLLDIVYRYILVSSTMWVGELALWLGGVIYLSAGLYAMQQRSHIRISAVYDLVPLWCKRLFDILSLLCFSFFAFWVIWGGVNTSVKKFFAWERLGTVFDPPIPATNKMLILVLLFLFTIQVFSNFVRDWPMPAKIRQGFDGIVTVVVTPMSIYAIHSLLTTESNIPTIWKWGISGGLVVIIIAVITGLIQDFHTTPEPFEEKE